MAAKAKPIKGGLPSFGFSKQNKTGGKQGMKGKPTKFGSA